MRTQHPNLPQLWRGDFSDFAQTMASTWQDVPIPTVGGQDSGNVWLAITRPGQGEALFYGPQRFFGDNIGEAWVAPLDPQSASDWHQLDTHRARSTSTSMACSCLPISTPGSTTAGTWRPRGPFGC